MDNRFDGQDVYSVIGAVATKVEELRQQTKSSDIVGFKKYARI